ncbi:MAG: alpha-glucosidase [Gammaproteobacteria bacterium]|nr:alpha-glucosidase [Gammaproteobacteria bacterium]
MPVIERQDGFDLVVAGSTVLRHRRSAPLMFVGAGEPSVQMNKGNFRIEDYLVARVPLNHAVVERSAGRTRIALSHSPADPAAVRFEIDETDDRLSLVFLDAASGLNRFWMRVPAHAGERIWGGGEQLSYFDLRGRRFPLWTSEPGVGRDKTTRITFEADRLNNGGGDYYNTNYPQPTYLSSEHYALHVDSTAYAAFDFRHADFHEIEVWALPRTVEIWRAERFVDLVGKLSMRFGRQPILPEWVRTGAIVGLKDGALSLERLERYVAAGAAVCGLWCEDWVGIRQTSFGKRLFWNWRWNGTRYPELDRRIPELAARGIRFLGYVNPYLCVDGDLYPEAAAAGYLVRRLDRDEPYLVDFGEFHSGIVDFTNSAAYDWFVDRVIGRNMLDFGLSGWMADFGEYLPTDVRLASGLDGMLAHNAWPTIWAKVNADAVASRGKTGDTLFFMRAGHSGVQAHCPLLWAGDQSVDFSRHDGLQTVICAALSSGLLGNAYHHSDIGGYTSLFGNVRTPELLMRWAEMAAFTAVMRTHEGNRPGDNLQIDQDPEVLAHFARMTRVYRHLGPYMAEICTEAATTGLPLQRPLFLHFEGDPRAYESQISYLFGADLLVAPVVEAGASRWRTYLPAGVDWVHVWSGRRFDGGAHAEVDAPFGQPPVFHRADSRHRALFEGLALL